MSELKATVPNSLTFKLLHDLTYGAQDKALENLKLPQPKYDSVYLTVAPVPTHPDSSFWQIRITPQVGKGLANIRLTGEWTDAKLELGGQQMSKIYKFMDVSGFAMTDNGMYIPFVPNQVHDIVVYINKPKEAICHVTYDIVNIPEADYSSKGGVDWHYDSILFTGEESAVDGLPQQRVRLHFNHPVRRLYVKAEKPIESLDLLVNDYGIMIPMTPANENQTEWLLDFGEQTVNFSRIDSSVLQFKSGENTIRAYAVCRNILRTMMGMYGAAFSK